MIRTAGGIERELRRIFDNAGVKVTFSFGAKHPVAKWTDASGRPRRLRFSGSPRTGAAVRKARADAIKMLQQVGGEAP